MIIPMIKAIAIKKNQYLFRFTLYIIALYIAAVASFLVQSDLMSDFLGVQIPISYSPSLIFFELVFQ